MTTTATTAADLYVELGLSVADILGRLDEEQLAAAERLLAAITNDVLVLLAVGATPGELSAWFRRAAPAVRHTRG